LKKGCLIAAGVVILVLLAGIGVAWYRVNRQFGLTSAELVSHETLAEPATRLRAVVKLDELADLIVTLLPPEIPMPSWLPYTPEEAVRAFLPYEAALLAASDYGTGEVRLTFFVNERRGGPIIVQELNRAQVLSKAKFVRWLTPQLELKQRGVITATGALPLPDGVEEQVLRSWTHDSPGAPLLASGSNQLEVVLDNRNGDIVTYVAAVMKALGQDWRAPYEDPIAKGFMDMLVNVFSVRLTANLTGRDTAEAQLRLDAAPAARSQLEFLFGVVVMPQAKAWLQKKYGLVLDGETKWDETEEAMLGNFKVIGLEQVINRVMGARKPAA